MGNSVSTGGASSPLDESQDLEWLTINSATLLNDGFIIEKSEGIPLCEGLVDGKVGKKGQKDVSANTAQSFLIELFKDPVILSKRQVSVEQLGELDFDHDHSSSQFFLNFRKRCAVLQRIHLALLRQGSVKKQAQESNQSRRLLKYNKDSPFMDKPMDDDEYDDCGFSMAANTRMILTMMRAIQHTVPTLFAAMSDSLLELLGEMGQVPSIVGGPDYATLVCVHKYAQEVCESDDANCGTALALLLGLGTARCSMRQLLSVAEQLLRRRAVPILKLPPRVVSIAKVLLDFERDLGLNSLSSSQRLDDVQLPSVCAAGDFDLACDGCFLYVRDESGVLHKVPAEWFPDATAASPFDYLLAGRHGDERHRFWAPVRQQ
jgi:hypothetical protein